MFSVEKTKDGNTFTEVLPFNPIVEGWAFVEACCCSVEFSRGDKILTVAKEKGYVCFSGESKSIHAFPADHLAFQVLCVGQ